MGKVIGILNYKGGVAKTTTAVNLGTALWILGYKVLMIDADMQRNLTINMNFKPENKDDYTFDEWMRGTCGTSFPVYERYDGLDYVPASKKMSELDIYLSSQRYSEMFLRDRCLIKAIRDAYDYIIIDCPPHRGSVNDNVMTAADGIIIPTDESFNSLDGIMTLANDIKEVKKMMNPNLDIMGVLRARTNPRTLVSKSLSKLLEEIFPGKLFNVIIRPYTGVNATPTKFQSLFEYDPESTAADGYMRLAEIIADKKRPRNWQTKAGDTFEKTFNHQ